MTLPEGTPVTYVTVTPVDDARFNSDLLRLVTTNIGAWGTRTRFPGEPPRTFIMFAWGFGFDIAEDLSVIDAAMGYVP